jgi:hypothetical protein
MTMATNHMESAIHLSIRSNGSLPLPYLTSIPLPMLKFVTEVYNEIREKDNEVLRRG